jgi:hypothetical protein
MRVFILVSIVLLTLGLVASGIAAVVDIETIVFSGPLCSLVGIVIAALCYRKNIHAGFLFGLSVPTLAVLCFTTILGLEWSPGQAQVPIGSVIVLFVLLTIPMSILALLELRHADMSKRTVGFQYGIAELLGLMFLVAVVVALLRTGKSSGMAIGVLVGYGIVAVYVLYCFYTVRRRITVVMPGDVVDTKPSQAESHL